MGQDIKKILMAELTRQNKNPTQEMINFKLNHKINYELY